MLALLLASSLAVAAPDVPHVPEPMVYDLVRGLGAKAGEIEVNNLGEMDMRTGAFTWAPEIEVALHDNVAVELELPMVGVQLAAIKGAFQVTFNVPTPWFIHGAQVITEHFVGGGHEFAGTYLWGIAPKGRFSMLGMSGVRSYDGPDTPRHVEAIQNTSMFLTWSDRFATGLETNLFIDPRGEDSWLVMPQAHVGVVPGVTFQIGGGARNDRGSISPTMGGRLIFDGKVRNRREAVNRGGLADSHSAPMTAR